MLCVGVVGIGAPSPAMTLPASNISTKVVDEATPKNLEMIFPFMIFPPKKKFEQYLTIHDFVVSYVTQNVQRFHKKVLAAI